MLDDVEDVAEEDRSVEAPAETDSRAEFERFFGEVARPLVAQAYVLTGDLPEAQDLAQEALVQAWRNWSQIRAYDDPAAWVRRVLHNLAVSWWRRLRLRHRYEAERAPLAPVAAEPGEPPLDVLAAIGRLPARQRRAVVLHDLVGLTADEIGREMSAPGSTVRTWLHRAHRRLEKELGDE